MANKRTADLRQLETRELELRLEEAQNDLMGTRFNLATRQTENTSRLADARHQIARIKTLLTEREQEA
ncbi:MAG: 50S ribosomal protein L29 [Chloroflexota bacterium]|nr:MAG: 50S ribosomal protein L29 [Chloroflexota bacterium]